MSNDLQEAASQHAIIGNAGTGAWSGHTPHPGAQWFGDAGLGLFMHFGISAVRGTGDLSWSMMWTPPGTRAQASSRYGIFAAQLSVSPEEYWAKAKEFRPTDWNPERILTAAKAAGCTYAVLTTKHHDGFTLWPSKTSDLGVQSNGGTDLVRAYVDACRKLGLKVGFYYSPPDWYQLRHFTGFPAAGGGHPARGLRHEVLAADPPAPDAAAVANWHRVVRGHIEELLTGYGHIDLMWFDGSAPGAFTHDWVRSFQPHIVINRRQEPTGDFETPECSFPKARPAGWWEYCHILNDGAWGYLKHECYKPTAWLLGEFAKARAWGGNMLINVGPDAQGRLPAAGYDRFAAMAAWMKHSGASVIGAKPGTWPAQSTVPMTVRGKTSYLHVTWEVDDVVAFEAGADPVRVTLMRDGQRLAWRREGARVVVDLPSGLRTLDDDVIEVVLP